jgi:hypothetical protein
MGAKMKPLLDADVLLYEVGFSSEQVVDGEVQPNSWEFAQDLMDKKIKLICEEAEATEPPLLFLTNTPRINKALNKQREREDVPPVHYVENFRVEVADKITKGDSDSKEYKSGRKQTKPFHFYNLLHYLLASYPCHINEHGLEADDAMVIHQYSHWKDGHTDTVICSRDKDVRQCPGWHYSWEVGAQSAIGPLLVDDLGWLTHKNEGERDDKGRLKPAKIFGVGQKFFYYQLLVGDKVDAVAGIKNRGPVFAYNLLKDASTVRECYELVAEKYVQAWEDRWKEKMRQQSDLLWMIREVDENGEKIKWKPPQRLESVISG